MNEPMIWAIVSTVVVLGLTMLAYLLREKFPNLGNTILTLVGLAVAFGSLYVSIVTLQKTIEDSKEQQKSLDASRKLLEAVVETVKNEQEVLTKHLETSRSLLALQKEQLEVFAKSLEISKAQLTLQKEERQRLQELANRKPRLQILVDGKVSDKDKIDMTVVLGKDNRGILEISFINSGNAPVEKPIIIAIASKKEISVVMEGTRPDSRQPYRSQAGAPGVPDFLPKDAFTAVVHLTVPVSISDFDLVFYVGGHGLENRFSTVIHVLGQRS